VRDLVVRSLFFFRRFSNPILTAANNTADISGARFMPPVFLCDEFLEEAVFFSFTDVVISIIIRII
jgi:hypothetical protein